MQKYSQNVKVVTTAQKTEDSLGLLELYENTLGVNLIAFAMGEAGII